jgi:hypothetical protein
MDDRKIIRLEQFRPLLLLQLRRARYMMTLGE